MHAAFADTLRELGARVVTVAGTGEARTALALQAVLDAAPAGSAR